MFTNSRTLRDGIHTTRATHLAAGLWRGGEDRLGGRPKPAGGTPTLPETTPSCSYRMNRIRLRGVFGELWAAHAPRVLALGPRQRELSPSRGYAKGSSPAGHADKVCCGGAPQSAREGACAPQILHTPWLISLHCSSGLYRMFVSEDAIRESRIASSAGGLSGGVCEQGPSSSLTFSVIRATSEAAQAARQYRELHVC